MNLFRKYYYGDIPEEKGGEMSDASNGTDKN